MQRGRHVIPGELKSGVGFLSPKGIGLVSSATFTPYDNAEMCKLVEVVQYISHV